MSPDFIMTAANLLKVDIKRLTNFRAASFWHGDTDEDIFSLSLRGKFIYLLDNIERSRLFRGNS